MRVRVGTIIFRKLEASESMGELLKTAWRVEEKIFQAATDQQDYLRKISEKMLSVELKVEAARPNNMARLGGGVQGVQGVQGVSEVQGVVKPQCSSSLDSSGGSLMDHRDIVSPKLQVLKDKYLEDMKKLHAMLTQRSTKPMRPEKLQNLKRYNDAVNGMIPYLTAPKERVPHEFNRDKVEAFEKQAVIIMESFKRRKQLATQQPNVAPQQQMQQLTKIVNIEGDAGYSISESTTKLSSEKVQAGVKPLDSPLMDSSGRFVMDHRDVVWLKLQVLKQKYLQDMKELHAVLTQRSKAPMPPEQLQKLEHYKRVLNRMIPYLIAPKEKVPSDFNQDKVEAFEKQIVNIMEPFKRRKQLATQKPNLAPQQQQAGQASINAAATAANVGTIQQFIKKSEVDVFIRK